MYTLRIIEETRESENEPWEQVIEDHELGDSYSIIKKSTSPKEFKRLMDMYYPESTDHSQIRGIVVGSKNKSVFFLCTENDLRCNAYYTMSDGKTITKW